MNTFDKLMTVLISVGLFTLGVVALCLAALFLSGCAHPQTPPVPVVAGQPTHVVLEAWVSGSTPFCVEDPQMNDSFEQPYVKTGTVCRLTVNDVRVWAARLRAAD